MEHSINITNRPIDRIALIKRILIGGSIGFMVISVFVFGVEIPDPEWGKYWRIRPLLICPLSGAIGGTFYYFMDHITTPGTRQRTLTNIISILIFITVIWLGSVLALVGTMWH